MKKVSKIERHIIDKIKRDYDYWQGYVNEVEDRNKEIEDKKKSLIQELKENPDSQTSQDAVIYLNYDYHNYMKDLRILSTRLTELYRIADEMELTEHFNESLNNKMQKILGNESELTFVYDKGKLVERVKGERDKKFKEIKETFYDDMVNIIVDALEKEN